MTDGKHDMLRVHARRRGTKTVHVAVDGELDIASAGALDERLCHLTAHELILDLAEVRFVDLAGLSGLLATVRELRRRGRRVRCVRCSGPVRRLVALTGTEARLGRLG